ncbi:MAG: transposase [Sedimentisphaerales bacterium]
MLVIVPVPGFESDAVVGILWILRTGAPWADLPKQFPSPSICWRRFRDWEEQDIWLDA